MMSRKGDAMRTIPLDFFSKSPNGAMRFPLCWDWPRSNFSFYARKDSRSIRINPMRCSSARQSSQKPRPSNKGGRGTPISKSKAGLPVHFVALREQGQETESCSAYFFFGFALGFGFGVGAGEAFPGAMRCGWIFPGVAGAGAAAGFGLGARPPFFFGRFCFLFFSP